jgi:hypothetical protein
MTDKYKKRVHALQTKLDISYQAADNILRARARTASSAPVAQVDGEVPQASTDPGGEVCEADAVQDGVVKNGAADAKVEGEAKKLAAVWVKQWRDGGPVVGRLSQSLDFPEMVRLEVTRRHDYVAADAVLHLSRDSIDIIQELRPQQPDKPTPHAAPLPPPAKKSPVLPHKVDSAALEQWHRVLGTLRPSDSVVFGALFAVVEWTPERVRLVHDAGNFLIEITKPEDVAHLRAALAKHFSAQTELVITAEKRAMVAPAARPLPPPDR